MRKAICTILFTLLFSGVFAQRLLPNADTAKYLAEYSVKWYKDTLSNIYDSEYFLLINPEYAQFISRRGYHIDTLRATKDPDAREKKSPEFMSGLTDAIVPGFNIYKFPDSIKTAYSIGGKLHMTSEANPACKWKLTGEEKELAGYPCQKAETRFAGRDYTAWFTNEIPVRDGPYKFSGLPGFIVKLYDAEERFIFELRDFSELKMPVFRCNPERHEQVSKSEYFKRERQFMNDIIGNMQAAGINFPQSEEELHKKSRKARLTYNPIERIE